MRRHYLFPNQEHERGVGDGEANLLQLWLARRTQLLQHESLARYIVLFWDLAKARHDDALTAQRYCDFFARIAKALLQSVNADGATAIAPRDWLYDTEGAGSDPDAPDSTPTRMNFELFREALLQLAELLLPVESDESMFVSFFRELRECIAMPVNALALSDDGDDGEEPSVNGPASHEDAFAVLQPSRSSPALIDATAQFRLRPLKDVPKIRGAFVQKMPPGNEQLKAISALAPPDSLRMSLKQLLLSYNPRKFALSRRFSALFADTRDTSSSASNQHESSLSLPFASAAEALRGGIGGDESDREATACRAVLAAASAPQTSRILNKESEDVWDAEVAGIHALEQFPALRVAVVGPPHTGKTRVAKMLADRLQLQYVSLGTALEHAVQRKQARMAAARAAAIAKAEAEALAVAAAATEAAGAASEKDGDAAEALSNAEAAASESIAAASEPLVPVTAAAQAPDVIHEEDVLFTDADFDLLFSGGSLARSTCIALLVVHVRRSLLEGVGVVLDDVHPAEIASEIGVDFVIVLSAAQTDVQQQVQQFTLAPTSRRVYSARERAVLAADAAQIQALGFGDTVIEPPSLPSAEGSESAVDARTSVPQDASEDDAPASDESSPLENADTDDLESTAPVSAAPPLLTQAERNLIEPPDEATRYEIVHVLAAQSLCVILDQCVHALTGNTLGISRTSVSRRVVPVALPDDVASSSRAEQLRWLLQRDWRELNADAETEVQGAGDESTGEAATTSLERDKWSRLPTHRARRLLSRWREFCPVTSSATGELVRGNPHFAVVFNGRVYLTASLDARAALCAHPLQYLRLTPPPTRVRRVWLVSSSSSSNGLSPQLPALAQSLDIPLVDALDVLAKRCPMAEQMALMQGVVLANTRAAALVAESLPASDPEAWLLANMPFTAETVAALSDHARLPDLVLVVEPRPEQLQDALARLKHERFQASLGAATEAATALGVHVKTTALHDDSDDTVGCLLQQVDPLAPRIDSVDDGHVSADDLAAAFALPSPENDDPAASTSDESEPPPPVLAIGETNRFCPVTWTSKRVLVPGVPDHVAAFNGAFYCFVGSREREVFARNPRKYVPQTVGATADVVPTVLLLGVRGTDVARVSKSVASASSSSTYAVVDADLDAVAHALEQRLRTEALRRDEMQRSPDDLYVDSLQCELTRCEAQCRAAPAGAGCVVLAGLGADESRLPTPELLANCVAKCVCPLLVVPITLDAARAVATQLEQWRAQRPVRRKKLRAQRAATLDGDDSAADSTDGASEQDEEDAEAAEADETQRLHDQYAADAEALAVALETLRARGVTVAAPIDGGASLRQRVQHVMRAVDALMMRKPSLLEQTEVVRDRAALVRALASGEVLVGKHSTMCPVTGSAGSALEHAVVYRGRAYFPSSAAALAAFTTCPSQYVTHTRSAAQSSAPTCCVAGAPGVGKTRFALALAAHYGLVYVSPRAAVDWVVQCHGGTALSARLRAAHTAGAQPDARAIADALVARLQSSECQMRGWVLDDFLETPSDLERFVSWSASAAIDPSVLFLLDGDLRALWQRCKQQLARSTKSIGDDPTDQHARAELATAREQLAQAFGTWQRQHLDLLGYWSLTYGSFHVQQLDATAHSLWHVLALARARLDDIIACTRRYRQDTGAGRAASLHGVVRRSDVLRARVHPMFQGFCPVELAASRYASTWTTIDRRLCVQFGAHVFWLASARNAEAFIAAPHAFVGATELEQAAQRFLEHAPLDASLLSLLSVADCEFPELKAYCPVTFALGAGAKDWRAIVKGEVFYRATYRHKVYFFASERMRQRFVREPARFADLKLPVKLPPQLTAALGKNYAGRLEQELASVLNESLLLLGSARPKFLQTSARASACVFLALVLKTHAPTLSPDVVAAYRAKQQAFERDCRLTEALKAAITPSHASCGSGVKGVRAVLASSSSSSSLSTPATPDASDSVEALCRRFDAITGCSDASPRIDAGAVRASFVAYTQQQR